MIRPGWEYDARIRVWTYVVNGRGLGCAYQNTRSPTWGAGFNGKPLSAVSPEASDTYPSQDTAMDAVEAVAKELGWNS